MRLHTLEPDVRCPYCHRGGLAFVRPRRFQGDLYRCTAPIPCRGLSLHYRKNGRACGVAAEGTNGLLVSWCECPGQEQVAHCESPLDHLTTGQVAQRLQVDVSSVVRLLATGKLSGSKVNDQWRVPSMALREYVREGPPRRRVAR